MDKNDLKNLSFCQFNYKKKWEVPYAVTSAQSGGRIAQQTRMRQTTAMTRKTGQTLHTVGFG